MAALETIRLSKNNSAQWMSLNPILDNLEIGYETNTKFFKIGNGVNHWNSLAYVVGMTNNALFISLSDDPNNMIAMTSDGNIILHKNLFDGTSSYISGKEQGSSAPTVDNEYKYTLLKVGQDINVILSTLVSLASRSTALEAKEVGDSILDTTTTLDNTWSSAKIVDYVLSKHLVLKADITENANGAYDALVRLAELLENNTSLAVTVAEELSNAVRFNEEQTLTENQKSIARNNIGAIGNTELNAVKDLITNNRNETIADMVAQSNRIGLLESSLHYLMPMVSVERTDIDSDGLYRRITHRLVDGAICQISQLEHDPMIEVVNGVYNKRVISIYNKAGTTIIDSVSYQIKYDTNGTIVSETLLP